MLASTQGLRVLGTEEELSNATGRYGQLCSHGRNIARAEREGGGARVTQMTVSSLYVIFLLTGETRFVSSFTRVVLCTKKIHQV